MQFNPDLKEQRDYIHAHEYYDVNLIREDVRFLSLRHPLAEQAINREGPGAPDQDGYS
jgi:hypothetical protein